MPEWVYGLGWLAVPALAVALSVLWHERSANRTLSDLLTEIRQSYYDTLVVNRQLRSALHQLESEQVEARHALVQPNE